MLDAAGVKMPTDGRGKQVQEEERQQRLIELERRLSIAYSPCKLNRNSESILSHTIQKKKLDKKLGHKSSDQQFEFPNDKYLMSLGTKNENLSVPQQIEFANEATQDVDLFMTQ